MRLLLLQTLFVSVVATLQRSSTVNGALVSFQAWDTIQPVYGPVCFVYNSQGTSEPDQPGTLNACGSKLCVPFGQPNLYRTTRVYSTPAQGIV